ncbi:hypothetical protein SBF1_430001 [Candidatus Desulfosporosinus infrequens]|uniref:Uncharacterized protein n=1 Tax=Candidatus Desulfosporosinus infrequens TaxID=2043169 RepID=A0A2U3LAU3_9FIRM|nr:hypothetical protein SBF1_430001 [Candidatus Desulfosporosinus infrequens]
MIVSQPQTLPSPIDAFPNALQIFFPIEANDHTKIGLRFGDMGIIHFMLLQALEPKDNILALIKFIEVNIPVPLWYFMLFVSFGMYAARISVEKIKDTVADITRNLN